MTYEIIPKFHLSKDRVQKHEFTLLEYFLTVIAIFAICYTTPTFAI